MKSIYKFIACVSMSCGCGAEISLAEEAFTAPGPHMRAGDNCISCHKPSGEAGRRPWTAAGTVYPSADADYREGVPGVRLIFTDAEAKLVTLTTNEVGNFYTDETLAFPYVVRIEFEGRSATMPVPLDSIGACAGCHTQDGRSGALGRIRIP